MSAARAAHAVAPATARPARPTARPAGRPATRPSLRLAPQVRSRVGRTPFVAVVVGLLGAGLLGLLALNTVLAEGAFRLHELERQAADLAVREQVLQRRVEVLRAPGSLEARARSLGMVPAGPPVYLRLSDGAVLGNPVPAAAPVPPPAPQPAAAARPAAASRPTAAARPSGAAAPRPTAPAPRPTGATR